MKTFPRIAFLFIAGFFLATLIAGCATPSGSKLETQATLKLSDVPIPSGLKPLPQTSYSFENAGVRVAVLKYQGKVNIDQLISFYKERMPSYNWNLINIVEYGQRVLNFERENETCIISMQVAGFWNEDVLVTVSLGPKSVTPAKKAVKSSK